MGVGVVVGVFYFCLAIVPLYLFIYSKVHWEEDHVRINKGFARGLQLVSKT